MAFCSSENNNSQHKTPRVTPLGVFCFSQCFRVFPTDRVPHGDSLFAEPGFGGRAQPASSPPTPPKSPLQLSVSLLNTPLRVHNPFSLGSVFGRDNGVVARFPRNHGSPFSISSLISSRRLERPTTNHSSREFNAVLYRYGVSNSVFDTPLCRMMDRSVPVRSSA